jgi:hypothetical protein
LKVIGFKPLDELHLGEAESQLMRSPNLKPDESEKDLREQ